MILLMLCIDVKSDLHIEVAIFFNNFFHFVIVHFTTAAKLEVHHSSLFPPLEAL